jgi:hypothetical protein
MAKVLDYDKGSSPGFADYVRDLLPKDPQDSGFRRLTGSVISLDYELLSGPNRLRVNCALSEKEGKRWLVLKVDKLPGVPGFHDITFVRRAFFGSSAPALIYYAPDDPSAPLSDSKINLWMPLDGATLPSGEWRGMGA